MGYGAYTSSDWSKLKASGRVDSTASASQIFKSRTMDARFDPKYINMREAFDSEEHPDTTPIIIGLDVTGSMGYLSEEIAKNALNETMMKLYSTNPVPGPQLMFAAIGDVNDNAPLQVTQFESDIRIAEQLLDLWLEGRGGDGPEDYALLWHFASAHTKTDAFEKRGKKGFLFTIGDADNHNEIQGKYIEKIFGDAPEGGDIKKFYKKAAAKYHIYHINITRNRPLYNLESVMPGHIVEVSKDNINRLPEIMISVMQCVNGMDKATVIAQWDALAQPVVENALKGLTFETKRKFVF